MGKPYQECPYCGDHLDFGERCDCQDRKNRYTEQFQTSSTGQMVLPFTKKERAVYERY